jgi:hypothetical protein
MFHVKQKTAKKRAGARLNRDYVSRETSEKLPVKNNIGFYLNFSRFS